MIAKQLGHTMKTVFIHVPFGAIIDRIKKRNAVGMEQARYANRVLSIYPEFYAVNAANDLDFPGDISMQKIKSTVGLAELLPSSTEFPTGNLLVAKIVEAFKLQGSEEQKTMKLMPRMSHDFIVNTSLANPEQCASILFSCFKKDGFVG
jgi:hypothetical protein